MILLYVLRLSTQDVFIYSFWMRIRGPVKKNPVRKIAVLLRQILYLREKVGITSLVLI